MLWGGGGGGGGGETQGEAVILERPLLIYAPSWWVGGWVGEYGCMGGLSKGNGMNLHTV